MRGKGEGTISQRADGRWEGRINLGRGLDGKRKRKMLYGATQSAVVAKMNKLGRRASSSSTPTVKKYLNEWYEAHESDWTPNTQESYRNAIDLHLIPGLGNVKLEALTPLVIARWVREHKQKHGARRRIVLAHGVLRSALNAAVTLEMVDRNAAKLVPAQSVTKKPITVLTVDQATAFLAVATAHGLHALFAVALACGLRIGEALGLLWDNVNLTTGEISIEQQLQRVRVRGQKYSRLVLRPLKTPTSRRTLILPPSGLVAFQQHHRRQLEVRMKAGPLWVENGLVFTTTDPRGVVHRAGNPLHPTSVNRTLRFLLKTANLPRLRFHELRHSSATILLAMGVSMEEIQKLLGHAEFRTTSDIYTHFQKQTAAKAAQIMSDLFPAKTGKN
jgi:integrase